MVLQSFFRRQCFARLFRLGLAFRLTALCVGVVVSGPAKSQDLMLPPTITRLGSAKTPEGATVTIQGQNFLGVTFVGIKGLPMQSFRILSDRTLRAVLPPEATSGYVSVTGPVGTAQSPKPLQIGPSITDFSPASAQPGDTVTLTGYNLTAAKSVNVGAYEASFTAVSENELQLVVPARATSARIGVHGLGYSFTSAKYLQLPLTLKNEYVLLKKDAANLKAAMNGLGKDQFIPAKELLTAVSQQINQYFSSESAGMADALNNIDSALAVLTNSTLSSAQRSAQAQAFANAAAADVNALSQNYGVITYTPGTYVFTVPTNVYSVFIAVSGGDGGDGAGCSSTDDDGNIDWTPGDAGDNGGSHTGTFAVTPGQTLFVSVDSGESGDCSEGDGGNGGGASVTVTGGLYPASISADGGDGGGGGGCSCGDDGDDGQATIYW
jgi:IPT/TIG domain